MAQTIKKSDEQIQKAVHEELHWDTRVKETDVGVEVDRGIATLTGTVDSWAARVAAQQAAHRVTGVLDVANDIHVKLPGSSERTDTDIARAVRESLEWDVLVPHERIKTTVSNGVIKLEGTVDYWSEHEDAGRAIRNLAGVREVQNFITVEPPSVATQTVKMAIDEALVRHAAHAAKHIQISVADGKVTLSGAVPSWAERNTVEGAVRGTPGVRRVDNRLHIHS
jgi:osmotically-inducible protein OsmY